MVGYVKGTEYSLFFVRPGSGDVHKNAKKLIGMKWIREVIVAEGDCGFVVKADSRADNRERLGRDISRAVGGSSIMAVCHCQYKK